MSATGLEPVANGLKGQSLYCAAPIQEPTRFIQSIRRWIKKVSWILILRLVNSCASKGLVYQRMSWLPFARTTWQRLYHSSRARIGFNSPVWNQRIWTGLKFWADTKWNFRRPNGSLRRYQPPQLNDQTRSPVHGNYKNLPTLGKGAAIRVKAFVRTCVWRKYCCFYLSGYNLHRFMLLRDIFCHW